jgi:hypothetical protein
MGKIATPGAGQDAVKLAYLCPETTDVNGHSTF